MKLFDVFITLPDLPAAHAQHFSTVKASRMRVAINRALAVLEQNPKIKGRRISSATIRVKLAGSHTKGETQ